MSKHFKIGIYLFLALLLLSPLSLLIKLNAQSAYRGLIIDKFRFNYGVRQPGEVIEDFITIQHDYQPLSDGSVRVVRLSPLSLNFEQNESEVIYKDIGELPAESDLASWIDYDANSYLLDTQEEKVNVNFSIKIPEDATPGSKYAAVFMVNNDGDIAAEELSQANTFGTGLNAALGVQIFLTVSGDVSSNIDVTDIYATNAKGQRKDFLFNDFFFYPRININVDLKNTGNVEAIPRGKVIIHSNDNYVDSKIDEFDFNPTESYVLGNGTRTYTFAWDNSFMQYLPKLDENGALERDEKGKIQYELKYDWDKLSKLRLGNYKATLLLQYELPDGSMSDMITASTSFLIIPWQILLLILVPTVLLGGYVTYKYMGRKQKNNKRAK